MRARIRVALLAGGFGGARMAHGFAMLGETVELTVIGNTGDDVEVHGLHVSPDLDTVMYTLAGLANSDTGWGVRGETWSAAEIFAAYGEPTWFRLGDRDLATHVVRTARLRAGERLTEVTEGLARALGVASAIRPMTDDRVRTVLRTPNGWTEFQDYFVRQHHAPDVHEVRFDGITDAQPTGEVNAALEGADVIVIAPSNPYVSVAPILALKGVEGSIHASDAPVIAISPIVGGAALRGPAARMMLSLGGTPTSAGVAAHYAERFPELIDLLVVDNADAADADEISGHGIQPAVTDIVIAGDTARARLAREVLVLAGLDESSQP